MHGSVTHRRDQTPMRENWGAKWGGMCPSSWGSLEGAVPFRPPTPEIFWGNFMTVSEWYVTSLPRSLHSRRLIKSIYSVIYSVHNEGVDHDSDTDNYHRHLSLISSWTVCTHAFDCQRPWMTLNFIRVTWPRPRPFSTVALMRSVTLHMCSESTTKKFEWRLIHTISGRNVAHGS